MRTASYVAEVRGYCSPPVPIPHPPEKLWPYSTPYCIHVKLVVHRLSFFDHVSVIPATEKMLVRSKVTLGRCSGFQLQTDTTLSLCSHPERILLLLDQSYLPVVPVVLNSGCSWIPALCLIYFPFLKTVSNAYYWTKLLPVVISLLSVKIMAVMLLLGLDSPPVGADLGVEKLPRDVVKAAAQGGI